MELSKREAQLQEALTQHVYHLFKGAQKVEVARKVKQCRSTYESASECEKRAEPAVCDGVPDFPCRGIKWTGWRGQQRQS